MGRNAPNLLEDCGQYFVPLLVLDPALVQVAHSMKLCFPQNIEAAFST